jgi:hypothetical protein
MSNADQNQNGIICRPLSDGSVQVAIRKDGTEVSLDLTNREVATLAAQALVAAKAALEKAGRQPPDFTQQQSTYSALLPSSIGLGPARRSTRECLMLQFGEAMLGVELEKSHVQSLGQALLALGAPSGRPPQ